MFWWVRTTYSNVYCTQSLQGPKKGIEFSLFVVQTPRGSEDGLKNIMKNFNSVKWHCWHILTALPVFQYLAALFQILDISCDSSLASSHSDTSSIFVIDQFSWFEIQGKEADFKYEYFKFHKYFFSECNIKYNIGIYRTVDSSIYMYTWMRSFIWRKEIRF